MYLNGSRYHLMRTCEQTNWPHFLKDDLKEGTAQLAISISMQFKDKNQLQQQPGNY
uniref:Uncharacterized protein n=1 Tax=Arundo donax TaxID=35708 RepID=A0A0A9ADS0_ARUDO